MINQWGLSGLYHSSVRLYGSFFTRLKYPSSPTVTRGICMRGASGWGPLCQSRVAARAYTESDESSRSFSRRALHRACPPRSNQDSEGRAGRILPLSKAPSMLDFLGLCIDKNSPVHYLTYNSFA